MSKAIKVEDHVYQELDQLKGKGETFGQVIEELLRARVKFLELIQDLEVRLRYREWQQKRFETLSSHDTSISTPTTGEGHIL